MNIQEVINELRMNDEFGDDGPHSHLSGIIDILLNYIDNDEIRKEYYELG